MKKSVFGKILLFLIIAALSSAFYLYKEEPDFLRDCFSGIHSALYGAAPEVLLNETPVFYHLTTDDRIIPGSKEASAAAVDSHEDKLTVNVDKAPDRANLRIVEESTGQVVLEQQAAMPELPMPVRNGSFTYELTLEWTGESFPDRGKYVLEIPVTVDLPEKFVFPSERLTQGQLLEIVVYYVDEPEDILFEQSIYDQFRWHRSNGLLRGYLPTNYNVKPGVYQINYGVKSKGTESVREIEIQKYDYHIQYLSVDSKTEKETRNDAAYAEYHKYYTPVRNQSEPSRYYTEGFILPVKGRLTTEFGETRYVNNSPTSYRHLGLDIAAPSGTEVKAANRGKVVLARFLTLTGNTVMIDHGEGLFSVYHHMLNLSVKQGEIVERGQKIGEVGSTGFSTGPHLHFMMSYFTVNLEPGYFFAGQPVTYENGDMIL